MKREAERERGGERGRERGGGGLKGSAHFALQILVPFVGVFALFFRLQLCSAVVAVGVQTAKYSLDVMREYGRQWEPCNWSQASSYLKPAWNMRTADVKACLWHRRSFCQIERMKRSCWSFSPPEIASRPPFSSCPKTVFPRCPLVAEPLIHPSPADLPAHYSRVLRSDKDRPAFQNPKWRLLDFWSPRPRLRSWQIDDRINRDRSTRRSSPRGRRWPDRVPCMVGAGWSSVWPGCCEKERNFLSFSLPPSLTDASFFFFLSTRVYFDRVFLSFFFFWWPFGSIRCHASAKQRMRAHTSTLCFWSWYVGSLNVQFDVLYVVWIGKDPLAQLPWTFKSAVCMKLSPSYIVHRAHVGCG